MAWCRLLCFLLGVQTVVLKPYPSYDLNQIARQLNESKRLRQASQDIVRPLVEYSNSPESDPHGMINMSPAQPESCSRMNPLPPGSINEQPTRDSQIPQSKRARHGQYIDIPKLGQDGQPDTPQFQPDTEVRKDVHVLSGAHSDFSGGVNSQGQLDHLGTSPLDPIATPSTATESEWDWLDDFFNDRSNLEAIDGGINQEGFTVDGSTNMKKKESVEANQPGSIFIQLHTLGYQQVRHFTESLKKTLSTSHPSSSFSIHPPKLWPSDSSQKDNMQELTLYPLICAYLESCRFAINKLYKEFLDLPNSLAEVKKIGNWPVGILITPLVSSAEYTSVDSGDYTSLILPYDLRGNFYSPDKILEAFRDLQLSLYFFHNVLWNLIHTNDLSASYSDYQKLMRWLFDEVFDPKDEPPLFGKTKLQVLDGKSLGLVQFCIINLLENPTYRNVIALKIAKTWFETISA